MNQRRQNLKEKKWYLIIIYLLDDARKRYKKEKKYENALYNLYRQSNYYMFFIPSKIDMFDLCLVKAYKMLAFLKPMDVEYKFVQFLRFSELSVFNLYSLLFKLLLLFLLSSKL